MNTASFFEKLWNAYCEKTPSALKVKTLLQNEGNTVYNDHIAIRTFDDPRTDISIIAKPFIAMGYVEKGEYHFKAKKLYAKHFEHPDDTNAPKIFISQLLLSEFSNTLRQNIKNILDTVDSSLFNDTELILKGRVWDKPSYSIYTELQTESEYAAWMYVNGFCSNHFTVDVNKLDTFKSLSSVNKFLKSHHFKMNTSGGEIKGSAEQFLEQSSILADTIPTQFIEGSFTITSCYYEFAYRYAQKDGSLFTGFIANSADKIFESTDMNLQNKQQTN
ncbi:DUF1338 domain-containing protein [Aquimarina sp. W85]|uniref:DUF1338 domain-containing protein n=1 Tax=Aquimarina rhodophyticola TaxID=3342246 RepID=UPI00366E21E9